MDQEFLLWLSRLRIQLVSMRMQVQSLASLSGLKDLALPQTVVQVTDMAQIWPCYSGVDWQLHLQFDPLAWERPCAEGVVLKKKKKKKNFDGTKCDWFKWRK